MNNLLFFLILFVLNVPGKEFIKIRITNRIMLPVPISFHRMTEEDLAIRYPSVRKPLGAFVNESRTADLSVNVSATQWPDANIELASQFFKASIHNLYYQVDWIDENFYELHGKKYIYFEFESKVGGGFGQSAILKYTYIQYLVESDRTLVFSFNCIQSISNEWRDKVHRMMKGVRVR